MRWKNENELLTDPVPVGVPDDIVLDLIRNPPPLRQYEESVLVQVGISRIWGEVTKRPGIKYDGKEIPLIDFLCRGSWSGCAYKSFKLKEGEYPWLVQMKDRTQPVVTIIPPPYTDADVMHPKGRGKRKCRVSDDDADSNEDDGEPPSVVGKVVQTANRSKGHYILVPTTVVPKGESGALTSGLPPYGSGVILSRPKIVPSGSKSTLPGSADLVPDLKPSSPKGSGSSALASHSRLVRKVSPIGPSFNGVRNVAPKVLESGILMGCIKTKAGVVFPIKTIQDPPPPSLRISKRVLELPSSPLVDEHVLESLNGCVNSVPLDDSGFNASDANCSEILESYLNPFVPQFSSVMNGDLFECGSYATNRDFFG